jgi:hypothetical protein
MRASRKAVGKLRNESELAYNPVAIANGLFMGLKNVDCGVLGCDIV